jgi:histidine triad (HIT) family protein
MDCVFCKIINKEIKNKLLYEDEDVIVFPDIHPVKPVHLLIIPKEHIEDLILVENLFLFSKLFSVAQKMVAREGLKDRGFRIVINGGGAQVVPHLHIHLMGPLDKTAKL